MTEAIRPLKKQNFKHPDVVEAELEGIVKAPTHRPHDPLAGDGWYINEWREAPPVFAMLLKHTDGTALQVRLHLNHAMQGAKTDYQSHVNNFFAQSLDNPFQVPTLKDYAMLANAAWKSQSGEYEHAAKTLKDILALDFEKGVLTGTMVKEQNNRHFLYHDDEGKAIWLGSLAGWDGKQNQLPFVPEDVTHAVFGMGQHDLVGFQSWGDSPLFKQDPGGLLRFRYALLRDVNGTSLIQPVPHNYQSRVRAIRKWKR